MKDIANEKNGDKYRINNKNTTRSKSYEYKTKIIGATPADSNTLVLNYHHSIIKKHINNNCSALTGESESIHKAPKLKVDDRVRITKYKNISIKSYSENWS